ncbi:MULTISPECIES: hypothetical protein [unclassified Sphingomonas]|uniref:hypothetical protein n=1 Tax=unclassified Sphingomonas TaxID=196159 RepID=UPI002151EF97|nr:MULTISPECIES: hypothetical protein [unclassified Sphingomonas]MCR5871099.1 hypothetical protein [Sphingomonas sp. J344]UUY00584.1 hypothetical protein LRS08_05735 [Sphingomonas sp. J315]
MRKGTGGLKRTATRDRHRAAGATAPSATRRRDPVRARPADADRMDRTRFSAQGRHRAGVDDRDASARSRQRTEAAAARRLSSTHAAKALDEDTRRREPVGRDPRAGQEEDVAARTATPRIQRRQQSGHTAVATAPAIAAEMNPGTQIANGRETAGQVDRDRAAVAAGTSAATDQRAGPALAPAPATTDHIECRGAT